MGTTQLMYWVFGKVALRKIIGALFAFCLLYVYILVLYTETIFEGKQTKFCVEHSCHKHASCIEIVKGYECKCQNGFYGDGWLCNDLDECLLKIGVCPPDRVCNNTIGSYKCPCRAGYNETEGTCIPLPTAKPKKRICSIPNDFLYPHCPEKIQWMLSHWRSHPCYSSYGIDGSVCSILDYFSQVEKYCPGSEETVAISKHKKTKESEKEVSLSELRAILGPSKNFKWISTRISSMWSDSMEALQSLKDKGKLRKLEKNKKILVFIGALADQKWSWADHASKGGPLGELVQWSDLILSLYILGHQLSVSTSIAHLKKGKIDITPCESMQMNEYDLIYTDIHGLQLMEKNSVPLKQLRCKFRVLDSFGTEARFNWMSEDLLQDATFGIDNVTAAKLLLNPFGYGNWQLELKQFLTLFPHSPDNSFLGFIVGKSTQPPVNMTAKTNTCLVYGKMQYMWQGKTRYLSTINKFCEIHATVGKAPLTQLKPNQPPLLKYYNLAINYGILPWEEVQEELSKDKIFVGLGFPFEGPAPLEAIANGAVFINPKLKPPHGRLHDIKIERKLFFDGKPTVRELTSQHPYLEQFVGKPHVFTVDVDNETELNEALNEIFKTFKENKIHSYLPYEFTHEGFLERINAYVRNQNFCSPLGTQWPPKEVMVTAVTRPQESCKRACERKGLICDNDLFQHTNLKSAFKRSGLQCLKFYLKGSLFAPFANNKECFLQNNKLHYSCVDAAQNINVTRLCPCRDFIRGQVALCKGC